VLNKTFCMGRPNDEWTRELAARKTRTRAGLGLSLVRAGDVCRGCPEPATMSVTADMFTQNGEVVSDRDHVLALCRACARKLGAALLGEAL
jgi:hypothetical protein